MLVATCLARMICGPRRGSTSRFQTLARRPAIVLIDRGQPRHDAVGCEDRAGGQDRVGADAAAIANDRAELLHARGLLNAANIDPDLFLVPLVAVIREHDTGFD